MTNLIPMAGLGNRFFQEMYRLPKPFIPILGQPMFLSAVDSFPNADKYIFLCRSEHIEKYNIVKLGEEKYLNTQIVEVISPTQGQACTCLLAEKYLDENEGLFIASCDYQTFYSKRKYQRLLDDPKADVIIWTFKLGSASKADPNSFAYCRTQKEKVLEVVEKRTISDNPRCDSAVVGSFTFKKAGLFIHAAKEMIQKNIRVNGEFYVATSINQLIKEGYNIVTFEVDKFICFGTPVELQTFYYWQEFFEKV